MHLGLKRPHFTSLGGFGAVGAAPLAVKGRKSSFFTPKFDILAVKTVKNQLFLNKNMFSDVFSAIKSASFAPEQSLRGLKIELLTHV